MQSSSSSDSSSGSSSGSSGGSPSEFKRAPILVVSFGHLVQDTYASFLAPFLPLIIDKFSLSITMGGMLAVILRAPSLFNPIIGLLADKWNLRWPFILAPGLAAVCMSCLGLAPHYAWLCLLLLVTGVCSSVYHVVGPAVMAVSSGPHIGKGMGYWMTSGEMARAVGPLMAVVAITWLGFENSWGLVIIGLAATVFLYVHLKDVDSRSDAADRGSLLQSWRHIRHVMVPLFFLLVSRGLTLPVIISYLPVYLVGEGMSPARAGLWLVALEAVGTAGAFVGGGLSDRLGRKPLIALCMGVAPLAMLAFVYAGPVLRYFILPVLGVSVFSSAPVLLAVLQDNATRYRSTATGFYMATTYGVAALMIVFSGRLADLLGFDAALTVCAIGAMAFLPALFFLPTAKGARRSKPA